MGCQLCPPCPWYLPEHTAIDGLLKIKCWLSTAVDNLPQVCSWQQGMMNKQTASLLECQEAHAEACPCNQYHHYAPDMPFINSLMESINKIHLVSVWGSIGYIKHTLSLQRYPGNHLIHLLTWKQKWYCQTPAGIQHGSVKPLLHPKWHPTPYIVHYFWPEPYGSWSNEVVVVVFLKWSAWEITLFQM